MSNNNKKLFIIKPPGYRYDNFEPYITQIEDHFNRILSCLKVSTPTGRETIIKLNIDLFNPEKLDANAKRVSKDPPTYQIRMDAGISYYLWTASRTFAISEYDILPWIEECKINDARLDKSSKKDILSDYAYLSRQLLHTAA